jgi:hypothetical protein
MKLPMVVMLGNTNVCGILACHLTVPMLRIPERTALLPERSRQ